MRTLRGPPSSVYEDVFASGLAGDGRADRVRGQLRMAVGASLTTSRLATLTAPGQAEVWGDARGRGGLLGVGLLARGDLGGKHVEGVTIVRQDDQQVALACRQFAGAADEF